MRQRGQELVLAAVGLEQRALGVLQAADVEIDARPSLDAAGLVADGHALREDRVVFAVDSHDAVLAVPRAAGARGFLPRGHRVLDVVGVEDAAPAVIRRLLHREADEFEERIAGVDAAPVGVGHPHAIVDGFADGAVELFAVLERTRMRLHVVEHLVEGVDDHADLVVGHLFGTERVVALFDDCLGHRGHGFHRAAHHAVQPGCREQGGDEADDHHRAEHLEIGDHASLHVVFRAQVDSAEHFAALGDGLHDQHAFAVDVHAVAAKQFGYGSRRRRETSRVNSANRVPSGA